MSNIYAHRIRNLIQRGNPERAARQKRALIKLLDTQPEAVLIRFEGRCAVCREKKVFLSYVLPEYAGSRDGRREDCGYYCPSCGWGNAGSRKARGGK